MFFVGSFAFLPIPLYVGQLIARARLVTDVGAAQRGYLLLAFLWERVLDLWALAALYAVLAAPIPGLAAGALVLVPGVRRTLMGVARAGAGYLSRVFFEAPVVLERDVTEHVARGSVFTVSALLSVAAWTVVVVSIVPLATMAGVTAGVAAEGAAAARSILVGVVSLVPLASACRA